MLRLILTIAILSSLLALALVALSIDAGARLNRLGDALLLYWTGEPIQGGTTSVSRNGLVLYDWRRDLRHEYLTGCHYRGFAVSPDGRQIALDAGCGESSNSLYVMDTGGRQIRRLSAGNTLFGLLFWSPDGGQIAGTLSHGNTLTITTVDLLTGEAHAHITGRMGDAALEVLIGYSQDGQQLIINDLHQGGSSTSDSAAVNPASAPASAGSQVYLYDLKTGTKTPLPDTRSAPRWSPDGTQLLYTVFDPARNQTVFRLVDESGGLLHEISLPVGSYDIAWSPDSRQLALLAHETSITRNQTDALLLFDLATGKLKRISPTGYYIFQPVWQSDNRHISFLGGFPEPYIYTIDTTSGQLTAYPISAPRYVMAWEWLASSAVAGVR